MTEYFINKNVANMMSQPNPDSALDSQALIGNLVQAEKRENDYCLVRTADNYCGWVARRRLTEAWDRSSLESACVKSLFAPVFTKPDKGASLLTKLVIGSRIFFSQERNAFLQIILPDKSVAYVEKAHAEPWQNSKADLLKFEEHWNTRKDKTARVSIIAKLGQGVVETAKLFMGTPYLWGGSTPFGIDCSGMTQLSYCLNGVQLLRNSYMQYNDKRFEKTEVGKGLSQSNFQAGDLLFFDTKGKGKVDHVGIACGDGNFIQARGEVLDSGMVINSCQDHYYNNVYIGACRLSELANIHISAA